MQLQGAVRRIKERSRFEFVLGCKHHETSTAIRYKNIKRMPLAPWGN